MREDKIRFIYLLVFKRFLIVFTVRADEGEKDRK